MPSSRAIPATEACSRRIWLTAHQHARVVNNARGPARPSSTSVNDPAVHVSSSPAPGPLAPHQLDRAPQARDVDEPDLASPVAAGHDTAAAAALNPRGRLGHDPQQRPAPAVLLADGDDVESVQPHEQIATLTVGITAAARSSARRRLGHVEAFRSVSLVATDLRRALTLLRSSLRSRVAHTHRRYEEPNMGQAIAGIATKGGNVVETFNQSDAGKVVVGEIVVLAIPYPAVADVIAARASNSPARSLSTLPIRRTSRHSTR